MRHEEAPEPAQEEGEVACGVGGGGEREVGACSETEKGGWVVRDWMEWNPNPKSLIYTEL